HWLGEEAGGAIDGRLPLRIAALPPRVTPLDAGRTMDVRISLPRGQMSMLAPLSPLLQEPRGGFRAELQLAGPLQDPDVTGSLVIEDGSLRIPLREERLSALHARLRMDSLGVHVEEAAAHLGDEGRVTAHGRFRTLEDMDLTVRVRRGRFFETGVYRVIADGEARIAARRDSLTGEVRPHVAGRAEVREAQIFDITPRESPGPMRPSPWLIRMRIDAPGNIVVSQPNAQLRLGNGNLVVSQRDRWWNVAGSIEITGGWYRVFNNQFAVQTGELEFRETGTGIELAVHLSAQTQVTEVVTAEGEPVGAVTVTAEVDGPPDELQITLSSTPDLSREEIIELLSLGRFAQRAPGAGGATAETRSFLVSEFVARLENQLSAELPWLSRVRLAPGMDQIVIQPILNPQFSLNYMQELSTSPTQEVTLHYRLSNIIYLKTGLVRERLGESSASEEYNLDLKFRIEYE
ncbi:MAG: hypothetical protein GF355_06105, partial [Candidatus Eisenbacteria bacterium]|nr:hypothetical protein [Candidatus Eisenbacteria bacterium]